MDLWKLILSLKKEKSLAKAKLIQAYQWVRPTNKKIHRMINKRLLSLVENYDADDKQTFLRAVAHSLKF